MTADDLLKQAADMLTARGRDYDKPEGERSMASVVAAFRAITGRDLSEEDGWLLMLLVKLVRDQTARDRTDSVLDGIAFAALRGEAIARSRRGATLVARAVKAVKRWSAKATGRRRILGIPPETTAP